MEKNLKIDLNHATKDQLMSLPGIGEEQAARIIEYRRTHGGFSKIEELANIGPLPGTTLDDLRDRVEV